MPDQQWVYRCRVTNVVDGDTIDVVVDAGFRSTRTERLRLLGVNCPERKGATRAAGDEAREFTRVWLSWAGDDAWPLTVQTHKSDVFGRYLATVWRPDGHCLNDDLLADGQAVPFDG